MLKNRVSIKKNSCWSIGICVGPSPFEFGMPENITNPVLTAIDISDLQADFVSDPFMMNKDDSWYMFFEVLESKTGLGCIGLAVSEDGFRWKYSQIVLRESFHLSYPYVFEYKGEYYMLPECFGMRSLILYRANKFPTDWVVNNVLIEGDQYADASIVRYNDKWWVFSCSKPHKHDRLNLYFSDRLAGLWKEHPESPIIQENAKRARPGGRIIEYNNRLIRYAQDCQPTYGRAVYAFEILSITENDYLERSICTRPVLKPARDGWNRHGMHHVDPHKLGINKWIACVDGYKKDLTIKIEY